MFNNVSVISTLFQQCKLFFKTSLIWNNRDENQNSHFTSIQIPISKFSSKKIFADKIFSKDIDKIESNSRNLRGRFSRNPYTIYYAWCTIIPRIPRRLYISILRINEKKKRRKTKEKEKKIRRTKTCNNARLASGEGRKIVKIQRRGTGLSYFSPSCTYVFLNIHLLSSDYREISPFPLVFTSC